MHCFSAGILYFRNCNTNPEPDNNHQCYEDYLYRQKLCSTYRRIAFTAYGKKCNRCDYNKHPEILEVHHIDRNR